MKTIRNNTKLANKYVALAVQYHYIFIWSTETIHSLERERKKVGITADSVLIMVLNVELHIQQVRYLFYA